MSTATPDRPFHVAVRTNLIHAAALAPAVLLLLVVIKVGNAAINYGLARKDRGTWFPATTGKIRVGATTLRGSAPLPEVLDIRYSAPSQGSHLASAVFADQPASGPGSVQAMEGYATTSHRSGTVPLGLGLIGHVENTGSGELGFARGVSGGTGVSGTGAVRQAAALFAEPGFRRGSASIGTAYGVYVSRQSLGVRNFAFYSEMPTADLGIVDAGVDSLGQGWIRLTIGGRSAIVAATMDRQ